MAHRKYDYLEVARVWLAAVDAGRSPIDELVAVFGVTANNASNLTTKIRRHGLIPPSGRRTGTGPPSSPPTDRTPGPVIGASTNARRVLMCDDCEFECDPATPRFLIRHCLDVHNRPPTRHERTPARSTPSPTPSRQPKDLH